jgi:hypothetical protein
MLIIMKNSNLCRHEKSEKGISEPKDKLLKDSIA